MSSPSWFNFEDASGGFGTINIAADPNNDFEFVNIATSPKGTISFFIKDTAGNVRRPLRILEDPAYANVLQVDIGPGSTSSKLSLGGEVVIWAQKDGVETVFNDGGYDVDHRWEGANDSKLLFLDGGLDAVSIGGVASSSYKFSVYGDVNLSAGSDYYRNGVSLSDAFDALNGVYAPISKGVTNGDSHNHLGGDGGTIAYSSLSGAQTQTPGTYTPTLVNVANISSSGVLGTFKYSRLGNIVTVSGAVSITPTAGGSTATTLRISLPIASAFTDGRDSNGNGTAYLTNTAGSITADTTNDDATLAFLSPTTSAMGWRLIFQYEVL